MSGIRVFVVRWLARIYGWTLRLFPEGRRREYGEEMQAVFSLQVRDAARGGFFSLARFTLREVRDLPGAIVRTHLDERKAKMKPVLGDPIPAAHMSAWKIAAVFLPFGLALLYSSHEKIPETLFAVLGLALLGLLIAVWIAGLAKTFPLWSLPSLGVLLFFFYFYILKLFTQSIVYSLYGGWPGDLTPRIWMLLSVSLGTFLVVAVVLFGLLRLLPSFTDRVRQDWTLLSFLLYGLAIVPLFTNDEFHHIWGYQIAGLLLLATGAGLYLKSSRRWQRILALLVPVLLSQALLILGLYQTYPLESWSNLLVPTDRIWEAIQPLSDPLVILLLLPALVPFLPKGGSPEAIPPQASTLSDSPSTGSKY